MAYEAPRITDVGGFASTTLGNPNERLTYDGVTWYGLPDLTGPNPGSR
ncbi:lasso RiPP family leader peptide-containing protein [Microbacterium aurum]